MNVLHRTTEPNIEYPEAQFAAERPVHTADLTYTPKKLGPKYAPHDMDAPILEGQDYAGLALGTVITLGPLAAVALGL